MYDLRLMIDWRKCMQENKSIKNNIANNTKLQTPNNIITRNKKQETIQLAILLLIFPVFSFAQRTAIKDTLKSGTTIIIIQADRYNFQDKDSSGKFISLAGNAKVQQEKTFFDADSIVLNQKENFLEAFGHVHINDADSVHTYADYLKYYGKDKKAFLKNNVRLTDGKGTLTTNDLDYDVGIKMGTYHNGGKIVNQKTTITSRDGYYYGDTRDVYFYNKVEMNSPDTKIFTDTMLYNINTEITNFISPTTIFNGKRRVFTKEGFYDTKTKKAQFSKRSCIDDSTYTLCADDMAFEDSTGKAQFRGNAVYRSKDSLSGFDLIANDIKTNSKTKTLLATEKPILLLKQENDTTYISADTLFSARFTQLQKVKNIPMLRDTSKGNYVIKFDKDSSNDRYFEAYNHVRIFNDSLQAVADSMFYSSTDSILRLFNNPIAWAQDNQITGDTMYLFVKNKNPEKLVVFENAMAISKVNGNFFNQLRGNNITGFFKDEHIDVLKTKGSPAQNVYYAQDEQKKLVGVNQSAADVINIEFINNKPEKVIFINNLQGTMFPLNQVNHSDLQVKGFKWLIDLRPKSKFAILGG
jgi:lipopolysaccharide export system protein LptA